MVAHQAVSGGEHAPPTPTLPQQGQELLPVSVVFKYRLAPLTPVHYVVPQARFDDTK